VDEDTRMALEGSIDKWQKIVDGTGEDLGVDNCPLCQMFKTQEEDSCEGCPVMEMTGEPNCRLSPYVSWSTIVGYGSIKDFNNPSLAMRLAQAELDFLISLRPKDE